MGPRCLQRGKIKGGRIYSIFKSSSRYLTLGLLWGMKNMRIIGIFLAFTVSFVFCSADQEIVQEVDSYSMRAHDTHDSRDTRDTVNIKYKNITFSSIKNFLHTQSPRVKAIIAAVGAVPAICLSLYVANMCATYYFDNLEQTCAPDLVIAGSGISLIDHTGVYIMDLTSFNIEDVTSVSALDVICTYLVASVTGLSVFSAYVAGMSVALGVQF